jgi:RNA recognition motif-containing protein
MYKIFIGNMTFKTTHQELREMLDEAGRVKRVGFIKAHELPSRYLGAISQESKGLPPTEPPSLEEALPSRFRFVELATKREARAAIQVLKKAELAIYPGRRLLLFGPHGPIGEP